MEQILIYKPNGDSEAINSNDQVSVITQAEHRKTLLGEDVITMTVESATVRNFAIGDYIQVFGLPKYKINQLPKVARISERKYQYELIFEGLQYDLLRVSYRNTDVINVNNSSDFSLIGDIEMFLNVLVNNLNRVFGTDTWVLGDFPEGTETKNLLFNNENCLAVLQRLCEEYKYQFVCQREGTQNVLHVRQSGIELDYNFKYGQGKGLYKLERANVDTKNLVNTLWAYGSTKNLPSNYKGYSPRLRISNDEDLPILDSGSRAAYGIFEGSVVFEEIYPHRIGTVSAINTGDRLQFVDTSMNFDLNAKDGENTLYLIPGTTAKVRFQTGNLAGYEFEVATYVHSTKTFTLLVNKDQKGLDLPSETESAFQIAVGDTYIIVDIIMPQAYINAAEEQLIIKATEYLDNNAVPTVKYNLELDEFYIRDTAESENVFDVGDSVNIEDATLGIDSRIQIVEFTRDLLRPYKYTLTIKDVPQINTLRSIIIQNHYNRDFLKLFGLDDPAKAKNDKKTGSEILNEITPRIKKVLEDSRVKIGEEDSEVELKGTVTLNTSDFSIYNPALSKDIFKIDTDGNSVIGAEETFTKVRGGFGLENEDGFIGNFSVADITGDFTYVLPDYNAVLNDWDYLTNVPDSFPPSAHTHTISDITGLTTALNNKQPLDGDLTAIAGITGIGYPRRVATNTWAISEDILLNQGKGVYIGGELFIHNYNNASPSNNTFLGLFSGNKTLVSAYSPSGGNTGIGHSALNSVVDAGYTVAVGMSAMRYALNPYGSVAVGVQTLLYDKLGFYNTAVGIDAGKYLGGTTGSGDTLTGVGSTLDHSNNTLLGAHTGYALVGGGNTLLGSGAGKSLNGNFNIAIGNLAMDIAASNYTVAIGRNVLQKNTGDRNIGIGDAALSNNTSGVNIIGIGYLALYSNTTGSRNIALGTNALYTNTNGIDNVSIGFNSSYVNTGNYNVMIGNSAGTATTTGSENIFIGMGASGAGNWGTGNVNIGYFAGRDGYGSNNMNIGKNAGYGNAPGDYKLNIQMLSTGPLISGNFNTYRVGIGNVAHTDLTHTLTVNGAIYAKNSTPLTLDSTIGKFQTSLIAALSGSTVDLIFDPLQASAGYLFRTRNSGNATITAIGINRDGNVGVGIGNAVYKLQAYGTGNITVMSQSTDAVALYRLSGATYGQISNLINDLYITNTAAAGKMQLQTNSVTRMMVLADGKIGINQTSPTYQLDVNGTFRVAGASQFDAIASCPIAPTSADHLVNKAYVDSLALVKRGDTVYTIATGNVTLSGLQTINGYTLGDTESVLVIGQITSSQNGVYIASSGAWTRSATNDSDVEIRGAYHYIRFGTYANYRFINTNTSAITVETTAVTYDIDFGAETDPVWTNFATVNNVDATHVGNWNLAYSWGDHSTVGYVTGTRTLTINGTSGHIAVSGGGDLTTNRIWTIDLEITGTAGTYTKVTTDAYGRVSSGANPTTLAGYGITDALLASSAAATYQAILSGTGIVRSTSGTISYDTSTYLTESVADTLYLRAVDLSDYVLQTDAILIEEDAGERGFKLYSDIDKNYVEAFFFTAPDTGIVGIHAYRYDEPDIKEYGIEINKDGFLYHLTDAGLKHRLLSTNDLTNLTWSGGHITNDVNIDSYLNIYWGKITSSDFDARLYGYKSLATGERGFSIQTHTFTLSADKGIVLGSGKYPGGSVGDDKAIMLDGVILDLQGVNTLVGGDAKFAVTHTPDGYKLTLVAG